MKIDLAKLHLHWRGSKKYRSYSLARAYRVNGKNRRHIVIKLGKLSEEEVKNWRTFLEFVKKQGSFLTTMEDIIAIKHYFYLDVACANALWNEWELDRVFPTGGKRKVSVANIARILTINRCIDPTTKSKVPEWFQKTALSWILDVKPEDIDDSRVFRELSVIEDCKEVITKHLFSILREKDPNSMKRVFYDLSSTTFTGSKCVLMKWGYCKEGYKNHVVLALVVNQQGLPFYWEVLPGGTKDVTTIKWLLASLKERFKISEATIIYDRGIVSDENLKMMEKEDIPFITAMDKNQIEEITQINFSKYFHLTVKNVEKEIQKLPEFTYLKKDIYYQEIKINKGRRYILCFNPKLFIDQRKGREKAIRRALSQIKKINKELSMAKKSRDKKKTQEKFSKILTKEKISDFTSVSLETISLPKKDKKGKVKLIRSFFGTLKTKRKKKKESGKLDGFWLLVTSHSKKKGDEFLLSAKEAIMPYREKQIIESSFRDIKSFIEIEPVHVWTEKHVKAHYTLCVLAHLLNRTVDIKLHENKGDVSKDIISHERFFEELSSCLMNHVEVKNVQKKSYSITRMTDIQKELIKRAGITSIHPKCIINKANSSIS